MFKQLEALIKKPELHKRGTAALWTDEHISNGMLEAHLNPNWDAGTRNHATVLKNVQWIASVAPAEKYHELLDLGCGPGIYAEEFHKAGYRVSGMDFSKRSIGYAQESAREKNIPIMYYCRNFLTMDFMEQFDIITLIYYDFCTLPAEDRGKTLANIYAALKPGGLLIIEIHTPQYCSGKKEHKSWEYAEKDFYCDKPHLLLESFYRYDEQSTILNQYVIVTDQEVRNINVWHHTFTKDEFSQNLNAVGFNVISVYGNMLGADYCDSGEEMCFITRKEIKK